MKKDLIKATDDFFSSFKHWRIFCLIGANEIRKRYTRSKLGQFWLTLSLAINILTLGVVWSYLFHMQVFTYMQYIALGLIFWTYISSCINESTSLFIISSGYLKELNIPKLSYVNGLFVSNLIILGHNLIVLIPMYLIGMLKFSITGSLLSIAGLILTTISLYPVVVIVALISLRFRDLQNIINSIMQIVFYLTPILWKADTMSQKAQAYVKSYIWMNPVAIMLSICRDPLIGVVAPMQHWIAAIVYAIFGLCLAVFLFSKYRARITYWV